MPTTDAELTDQDVSEALRPSRRILRETFDKADVNGDGVVSRKEMMKFLKERGVAIPRKKSLRSMFSPKKMTFEQFCAEVESKQPSQNGPEASENVQDDVTLRGGKKAGKPVMRVRSNMGKVEHYKEIFKFLDVNNDGTITPQEMRDRMALTGIEITGKQMEEMVAMADTNNDSLIDFDEFVHLMNRLTIQKRTSAIASRNLSKEVDEERESVQDPETRQTREYQDMSSDERNKKRESVQEPREPQRLSADIKYREVYSSKL